ncbi:DUF1707 domain-containing protein [Nocardia puris]|uniref:Uncharacterized protein DUF1707 n=1 Tax=Nocardia puris TaxID=208602 RepID=A0A366DN71_9NOCA|nr:DUF1707 domain-containing protein [Nocardia puris]MBF6213541.1 DUF1707 domain-containing protein [Nocardia puris]MBF6365529.1 DUF1707 domain-containing protein [Nocardia puris]MBF6459995.1 DUF1707 domain-containing protein [Nocardia puris]RBO91522.1 uncharacterized protein DUF1707 [Nocardia puris]
MMADTARLRARDSDRADVCGLLDAALADGQLTAAEHAARTETAMRATSFGQLDPLIADLQIPGDLVNAPVVRGRGTRWWIPASLLLVVALFGMLVGCVARETGDAVGAPGEPSIPDLTTGAGVAFFLDSHRAEFGDAVADSLSLYPEYASFRRGTGNTYRDFRFDGEFGDPESRPGRKPSTPTLDFGATDVDALAPLLAGAARTLGVANGRITHLSFALPETSRGRTEPTVRVYVTNDDQASGSLTITLAGEVVEISPPTD